MKPNRRSHPSWIQRDVTEDSAGPRAYSSPASAKTFSKAGPQPFSPVSPRNGTGAPRFTNAATSPAQGRPAWQPGSPA
ncbi:hypothetical protein CRUP_015677, partial [Coryphaenoides rupestris]